MPRVERNCQLGVYYIEMHHKFFPSHLLLFLFCGFLATPAKVLVADPLLGVADKSELVEKNQPLSPRLIKANKALATFKKEDLIKRLKEAPPAATEKEVELGEKASKQIEKNTTIKVLDPKKDAASQALYDKLNGMAAKLGAVSGRPEIKYSVKVIESKELNAFTLPNGNIYFYTALLDTLYSDDEIAAVMAHEISHNVGMHALRGASKSRKFSLLNLAVLLAALGGGGKDAGAAVMFSQYLSVGLLNQYSEEYESEADIIGVADLIKAGYNPSAMVTVMNRFAVEDQRHPGVQMGIFQSHPEPTDRANAIRAAIQAAGLEFNPREVNGVTGAEVVTKDDNIRIIFRDNTLMEFPGTNEATKTRANAAADNLNNLLRANLHFYEIKISPDGENTLISARGTDIVTVTPADAALQETTTAKAAARWKQNLARLFWHETLEGGL